MMVTEPTWTNQDLQDLLQQQEWQAADHVTLALMLEATHRTHEGWLDAAAIARLPCTTLHYLDHLWSTASQGRFGFSAQAQVYAAAGYDPFRFSQQAGWLLCPWRPLGFHQFYDFLSFQIDAPLGHLPAFWYWKLGWQKAWTRGSFGSGRGGGFGDPQLLAAMMLRRDRCSLM